MIGDWGRGGVDGVDGGLSGLRARWTEWAICAVHIFRAAVFRRAIGKGAAHAAFFPS
jgi:hypothetical protein